MDETFDAQSRAQFLIFRIPDVVVFHRANISTDGFWPMKYKDIALDHLRNPLTLHLEVVTGFPCVATVTVLERLCAWETDATCHFLVPYHFTSQPNQMGANLEKRNRDERSASPRGSQGP